MRKSRGKLKGIKTDNCPSQCHWLFMNILAMWGQLTIQ